MSTDQMIEIRSYRGAADWPAMSDVRNRIVAQRSAGEFTTAESMGDVYDHLQRCDPETDIVLAEIDRTVVGYARVTWEDVTASPDGPFRAYWMFVNVDPACPEAEAALSKWAERRCGAVAAQHEGPGGNRIATDERRLMAYAEADSATDRRLTSEGFRPLTYAVEMVRSHLRDVPELPMPSGLQVRPVTESDWREIWEADTEAFRDSHGFVEQTEEDWERFRTEAAGGTELWQVAFEASGRVAGQVRTHADEGEPDDRQCRRAWTEEISTRREWRTQGVASALIAASLRQLATLGFDEAALGVDTSSPTGAMAIYQRLGFEETARSTILSRPL